MPGTPLLDNRQLGPDTARANLLTNGGFEIWQRGNGPFTSGFTTDRWQTGTTGTDTLSVSRDTTNVDTISGSHAAAACTFTLGTGAGASNFGQQLPVSDYQAANRTFAASIRVRTSVANAVRIGTHTGAAFVYGNFHSGGGAWETLTVTATQSASPALCVLIFFNASCTAYIDNAMLVVGSQPANYAPMHPADDLARCLRYYEIIGAVGGNDVLIGGYAGGAGGIAWMPFNFKAVKAVTPTMTKNGTWALNNSSTQPILPTNSVNGFSVQLTGTAAGSTTAQNSAAGCNITAESNP